MTYHAWLPAAPISRAILLFHRGHEHGLRWDSVVETLQPLQPSATAFFAWDARGHGRTRASHARHISDLVRDVEAFVRHLRSEHALRSEDLAVVAHSMAAVVVGQWALQYAPRLRALVLATPALDINLYLPFAKLGLRLLRSVGHGLGRPLFVRTLLRGHSLTHDPEEARRYDADPLITKEIAVGLLLDLYQCGQRLITQGGGLEVPVLMLVGGADRVVRSAPIRRLYERLPSPQKALRVYAGAYHGLFHETWRAQVIQDVSTFIDECFARDVDRSHLLAADRRGASFEDFQWQRTLRQRPALKLALHTVGRLSQGIRVGLRSGFSSGQMLAYVYANQAQGWTPLGRLMDRFYLDSPGWAQIRVRRWHLQQLVRRCLYMLQARQQVRIFDLAGGPGHYWIDLAQERAKLRTKLQIRVRDLNAPALEEGRRRAAALGLEQIAFEQGNAFDEKDLGSLGSGWQIGVISGLLELFSANAPLQTALRGAAGAIEPGGFLIYTNQPWNPSLEFIATLLTHEDGSPWTMRCRSQAEMDELVAAAGFDKLEMLADDDAVFTVSLARRR